MTKLVVYHDISHYKPVWSHDITGSIPRYFSLQTSLKPWHNWKYTTIFLITNQSKTMTKLVVYHDISHYKPVWSHDITGSIPRYFSLQTSLKPWQHWLYATIFLTTNQSETMTLLVVYHDISHYKPVWNHDKTGCMPRYFSLQTSLINYNPNISKLLWE